WESFSLVTSSRITRKRQGCLSSMEGESRAALSTRFRTVGLDGILRLVKGKPRDAEFRAVVAFRHEGKVKLFSGRVRGALSRSVRGTHGFGYDPIFLPHGSQRTTAEMEPEEKNAVSHRGKAVRQLAAWLRKQTPD
ncbi:MAG: hypothetical protein M1143_03585, partial [Candidatus Thermoplasmatota archaeon]|nr:hypothetical protein [Candidatus Thermoplasmatota archaeon]